MLARLQRNSIPHTRLVKMLNGVATLENSLAVSSQTKLTLIIPPSYHLPRHLSQKTWNFTSKHTQKKSCTKMFIAAVFAIAQNWEQPQRPREWLNKLRYIYTMEYYSNYATIWMNLKNYLMQQFGRISISKSFLLCNSIYMALLYR